SGAADTCHALDEIENRDASDLLGPVRCCGRRWRAGGLQDEVGNSVVVPHRAGDAGRGSAGDEAAQGRGSSSSQIRGGPRAFNAEIGRQWKRSCSGHRALAEVPGRTLVREGPAGTASVTKSSTEPEAAS